MLFHKLAPKHHQLPQPLHSPPSLTQKSSPSSPPRQSLTFSSCLPLSNLHNQLKLKHIRTATAQQPLPSAAKLTDLSNSKYFGQDQVSLSPNKRRCSNAFYTDHKAGGGIENVLGGSSLKKQKGEPATETKMPRLNAMTLFAFRVVTFCP